eukprot:CAMPEP_0179413270 /NCGR_PEP_ID=MMETSP0799-20121207/4999_1 /TAXON_ID=46947 /ORGANISM="Geminigera cryophila, Strain CCMP2564" /LENGTH=102 /DNA_ID=CAMNT_0021185711 /DNA_START=594 /DNA_END=899 /DNA_ORIENTATION=-
MVIELRERLCKHTASHKIRLPQSILEQHLQCFQRANTPAQRPLGRLRVAIYGDNRQDESRESCSQQRLMLVVETAFERLDQHCFVPAHISPVSLQQQRERKL